MRYSRLDFSHLTMKEVAIREIARNGRGRAAVIKVG